MRSVLCERSASFARSVFVILRGVSISSGKTTMLAHPRHMRSLLKRDIPGRQNKREGEKRRWNRTATGTQPLFLSLSLACSLWPCTASKRAFVFRISLSLSLDERACVTKDKCLFCTLKLSKKKTRRGRRRRRSHPVRPSSSYDY